MKNFLFLFLFSFLFSCSTNKVKTGNLIDFIPENTAVIVRSNSIKTLETDLKNNTFLQKFINTSLYTYLSDSILHTQYINPISEVLLAFSRDIDSGFNYTVITKQHPKLFLLDSLKNKKVETLNYSTFSIQKITTEKGVLFSNITDSVFIASSSEPLLKNILTQNLSEKKKKGKNPFEKIYASGIKNALTVFINGKEFPYLFSHLFSNSAPKIQNFTTWMAFDTNIYPDEIQLNGIAISQDRAPQLLDIFKGTIPQKNELARVTPSSVSGFVSYTFDDFEVLSENLKPFQKEQDTLPNDPFFQSLNEIGILFKGNEKIVALHAIDGNITNEALLKLQTEDSDFRNISINKITDSLLFNRAFEPLITDTKPTFFAQLDDFFVFTETEITLQEIITDFLNNSTLAYQPYYETHTAKLSNASSILLVSINENLKKEVSTMTSTKNAQTIQELKFNKHPMLAIQFVYDSHFAHINGIVKESQEGLSNSGITQLFAITLEHDLLTNPQLVTNHLSKGKDIVVQDVTNKLYLISSSGRVLWNKPLDAPILGKIHQVDLLKNGKLQMAFSTEKTFYVLDRNGKDVAPFPIKFKDNITQPLAVFDYDNNRDYRFIITQGSTVIMYDNKAKTVNGFTFNKANSKIVFPPKHLRIANKDYVLIAEENGKLHILHRSGAARININTTFDFGQNEIYNEDGQFVFITSENAKVTIDTNGKVSSQKLNIPSKMVWEIIGKTKVTLEDNILRINDNRLELPFGVYTHPKISVSNQRVLISITDIQQQRTYVYNSLAELLPNFPVYGTSIMDLGDATNNARPNGVVKGENNGVVLYELN
ncbi:MAG: hypothetical protein CVU03_07015 [Bacteroidetes bacterium HGW-Bacteroidetes-2]|jgi:hypothetical protein|nr:MAG: hypothetical protein CVU03_07015 [Bacteroidetes bacterium HGW-Bacteroidetes-2]